MLPSCGEIGLKTFILFRTNEHIGVGAQSTLGGTKFMPEKYVLKISKMPEFDMIIARKMPEFYIIIARKIFSRILGGQVPPPLPPVSYAYKRARI